MSVCFKAESRERAVNILARRLDGRRDFPDFVPFSKLFFVRLELYSVSFSLCACGRCRQGLCKVREVGGRGKGCAN